MVSDNFQFSDLSVRALIAPHEVRWPWDGGGHWEKLHQAVDAARTALKSAGEHLSRIDADPDLSPEGKARRRQQVGADIIAELDKNKALSIAQSRVQRMLDHINEKTGKVHQPPSTPREIALANEIRAYVRGLPEGKALGFLREHQGEDLVLSAALNAPPFLSGLSDAERRVLEREVVEALAPEDVKLKGELETALKITEDGWGTAKRKIAEAAGLELVAEKAGETT